MCFLWLVASSELQLQNAWRSETPSTCAACPHCNADVFQINTTFEDGTAYVGGDLLPEASALPVANIDTCAKACAWVEACGAWTFTASRVCELKHASGWSASEEPQAASGVLSRPAPPATTEAASVPSAPPHSGQEEPPALSPAGLVPPSVASAPAADAAPVPQASPAELPLGVAPAPQPLPTPLRSVAPGPSTAPEDSPAASSPELEQLPFPSPTLDSGSVATPPNQLPLPAPEPSLAALPLMEQPATVPAPSPPSSPETGAAAELGQAASPAAPGEQDFTL